MGTAEHLNAIDHRLDGIDHRLDGIDHRLDGIDAKIDQRSAAADTKFEQIDRRFDDVDRRFDEQRSEFRALFEASRSDFNNLYDFVHAQAERTDARFDRLQTEMRTGFADVHAAIVALAPRVRRAGGRRRH